MKLEEARQELHNIQELTKHEEQKSAQTLQEFEQTKQEIQASKDETRQAEEMAEELMAEQKNETKGSSEELLDVIKQLQTQFEQQKAMLAKYEPKLKKKDKENKELSLTMRQLRADAANAQLGPLSAHCCHNVGVVVVLLLLFLLSSFFVFMF